MDAQSARTRVHASPLAAAPLTASHVKARRRRPPSPQEQARRIAWGQKYGPLVGRMIREAIERAEA